MEQLRQLVPLPVLAAHANLVRLALKQLERFYLGFELSGCGGSRRVVYELVFQVVPFLGGVVVFVEVIRNVRYLGIGRLPLCDIVHLQKPCLQPLAPSPEGLVDRLGRGREPALQQGQREADAVPPLAIEAICSVELLGHVVRNRVIESELDGRQRVVDGVGDALGKQWPSVKLQQLLFDEPSHDIGKIITLLEVSFGEVEFPLTGVSFLKPLLHSPCASLEAISVHELHEELEVLRLAVMRRRREQEKVLGNVAEKLSQVVSLGVLDLVSEHGGGHLMRLVANDQVPSAFFKLLLDALISRELV